MSYHSNFKMLAVIIWIGVPDCLWSELSCCHSDNTDHKQIVCGAAITGAPEVVAIVIGAWMISCAW